MADDIKLSLVSSRSATEQLSRNFKSLSSGKVEAKDEPKRSESSSNNPVSESVSGATDRVRLSAEAVRSLANPDKQDSGTTDDSDVADANRQAATTETLDVRQATELAHGAEFSIQKFRHQALSAHGSGISYDKVLHLLSDV